MLALTARLSRRLPLAAVLARVAMQGGAVMEGERFVWYNIRHPDDRGVAAPVRRLLAALANER